jgi:hypothetical protein
VANFALFGSRAKSYYRCQLIAVQTVAALIRLKHTPVLRLIFLGNTARTFLETLLAQLSQPTNSDFTKLVNLRVLRKFVIPANPFLSMRGVMVVALHYRSLWKRIVVWKKGSHDAKDC